MKIRLTFFYLVLAVFFSNCEKTNKLNQTDVKSYSVKVAMDTIGRILDIRSSIQFERADSIFEMKFLFTKDAQLNDLSINGRAALYHHDNDTLKIIELEGDIITLDLTYTLPIDSFMQDEIIFLTRPIKWCPFIYDDINSYCLEVTLPKGYEAFSSGEMMANSNSPYKFLNTLNSSYPLIITPARYYSKYNRKVNNISISYYFHNKDTNLTNSIIEESERAISFCNTSIGNYNRNHLCFIEFPGFFCQSLETFLLAGSTMVQYFQYPTMKFWVSHELIHQWIGSGYFNTIEKDNELKQFISESLTEYIRLQFIEHTFGKDSLENALKSNIEIYNREIKGTEQDVAISENQPTRSVYLVGPLYFHWLRSQIGDEKWRLFIKDLYRTFYGKVIAYKDFKLVLEKYASLKMIQRIEKWTKETGLPKDIEQLVSP